MAKQIIEARVKQKVDTESNWLNNELRLLDGEQAFVRTDAGVSVNFKIGDGNKTFSELPYFYPPLTLGSISTTQTLSQLNALADGVWVARGSGTFAFGLTAEEGYFTTFRKVGTQWTLNSRTEVLFTAPNIDWIEDQLENHERRITWNESVIRDHSTYIQGLTNNINVLDGVVRNLDETQIKMIGQYPELDNPTFQSSFNRRLFNYVKNSLDTSTNFKTNTFNNVTEQFGFGTGSYKFGQRSNGTTYMDVLGTRHAFKKDAFNVGKDDDNYMELNYDVLIGRVNGVHWGIRKDINQTRASNLQMPMTGSTFRTAVISVNGEYADENGNVVFSGGGGGSEYVLPIASAARLGGIRVGSGLTIGFDGTLNAVAGSNIYTSNGTLTDNRTVDLNNKTITFTNGGFKADKLTLPLMLENTTPLTIWADRNGKLKYTNKDGVTADIGAGGGGGASYIAGLGITIDRNEISARVDGTTITTNASGQLVAVGGGGSEYVLPTATNVVKGGVRVDNKTTRMNGELIESLLPKRETIRIALSAFNTDLTTGDLNGFVAVRPFKIIDFKTTVGVVPSGSAITTGIKKNNSVITNTLSIINANNYTSVATSQPTFSSDVFAVNDRLNFYLPTGGIGSLTTGQNLQAVLVIEYTD